MSDVKEQLAEILQLQNANEEGQRASSERNRKLRDLKNRVALETAHLWVVCASRDSAWNIEDPTKIEIAGVSRQFEARARGCVIKPHHTDLTKCLVRLLSEGPETIELCLKAGQDISLTVTEGYGKQKEHTHLCLWVFDTFEAAEKHRLNPF